MSRLSKLLFGVLSLAVLASCTRPRYDHDSDGHRFYRDSTYSHNRYPERRYETDREHHIHAEIAQLEQELAEEERRLRTAQRYSSATERARREQLQDKLDQLRAELSEGQHRSIRSRYHDDDRRSDYD